MGHAPIGSLSPFSTMAKMDGMAALVLILILGIAAQWLAWRLRVPSILLLLLFGVLAGPVCHLLDPEALLGPLLLPVVSLSVALILFEGGLSLHVADLRRVGGVVRNLVTVGALTTAVISAAAARWVLGFPWPVASLLGTILMVTGPTVIGPLLRHVRPLERVGAILRWEGIVTDPLGALCAVLAFEAIHLSHNSAATNLLLTDAARTVGAGLLIGVTAAWAIVTALRRFWVPDTLHIPLTLATVAGAFVGSEMLQGGSGLFTVTVMGIAMANQRWVAVDHILDFKETLSLILISSLFIVLGARLRWEQLRLLNWRCGVFVGVLILIARPASVAISTIGSALNLRERAFLAVIAPRGIVAAAVASVFALRLAADHAPYADRLVPVVFLVITGTVVVYGSIAARVGRWLKVATPNAQGCLIVGASRLARAIGTALQEEGHEVLLVDTNRDHIATARLEGLSTIFGSIVSPLVQRNLELSTIGRLLALTPNDDINALAAIRFARVFGRSEVYQLVPWTDGKSAEMTRDLRGRPLFGAKLTWLKLNDRLESGATLKKTPLTVEFDAAAFQRQHGERATPLFLIGPGKELIILAADQPIEHRPGQTVVSLVDAAPAM
jgi:NhaP-type Na+/H+ or K+/H+ antiporter